MAPDSWQFLDGLFLLNSWYHFWQVKVFICKLQKEAVAKLESEDWLKGYRLADWIMGFTAKNSIHNHDLRGKIFLSTLFIESLSPDHDIIMWAKNICLARD